MFRRSNSSFANRRDPSDTTAVVDVSLDPEDNMDLPDQATPPARGASTSGTTPTPEVADMNREASVHSVTSRTQSISVAPSLTSSVTSSSVVLPQTHVLVTALSENLGFESAVVAASVVSRRPHATSKGPVYTSDADHSENESDDEHSFCGVDVEKALSDCSWRDDGSYVCRNPSTGSTNHASPSPSQETIQQICDRLPPGFTRSEQIIRLLQQRKVHVYVIDHPASTIPPHTDPTSFSTGLKNRYTSQKSHDRHRNTESGTGTHHDSTDTMYYFLDRIQRIIPKVAQENRRTCKGGSYSIHGGNGPLGYQRCLLYRDPHGRLYNMLVSPNHVGPVAQFEELLARFSGREAMIGIVVLCRSLPCAVTSAVIRTDNNQDVSSFQPAFLSLIVGLVLSEEISLTMLMSTMLVLELPSISAFSLSSSLGADWGPDLLKKGILLALTFAGAATGMAQQVLTFLGVALTMAALLANLGARSYHFMGWRPPAFHMRKSRVFRKSSGGGGGRCGQTPFFTLSFGAFWTAIYAGIVTPYMGHRKVAQGGKEAFEYVITTALTVAAAFVVSDLDAIQNFFVVGSGNCRQDVVNISVGIWWACTLLYALFLLYRIPTQPPPSAFFVEHNGGGVEVLLEKDHASPVGYRVPQLERIEINPAMIQFSSKHAEWCSIHLLILISAILALGIGAGIVYLAFTSWDEETIATIQSLD